MSTMLLAKVLGGSNEAAAFEAFARNTWTPLSIPEVERIGRVPHMSAYRVIESLQNSGTIRAAGKKGKAALYSLNLDDPLVKRLSLLVKEAVLEAIEEYAKKEGVALVDQLVVPTVANRTLSAGSTASPEFGTPRILSEA